jgi:hypothetical protein
MALMKQVLPKLVRPTWPGTNVADTACCTDADVWAALTVVVPAVVVLVVVALVAVVALALVALVALVALLALEEWVAEDERWLAGALPFLARGLLVGCLEVRVVVGALLVVTRERGRMEDVTEEEDVEEEEDDDDEEEEVLFSCISTLVVVEFPRWRFALRLRDTFLLRRLRGLVRMAMHTLPSKRLEGERVRRIWVWERTFHTRGLC